MKLLVLSSRFPYSLEKGDKLRLYHQLCELAKYHEITLVALSDHQISDQDFLMVSRLCTRVEILYHSKFVKWKNLFLALFGKMPLQVAYFYDKKLKRKFRRIVESVEPDHIYCQLIRAAPYAADLDVSKTLDYMDNYSRWTSKLSNHQSFFLAKWILKKEEKKVMAFEAEMFEKFNHHTIISAQDRDAFHFPKKNKIHCIRNGVDTDFFKPQHEVEKKFDVAFVGNLSYINNVEASKYIAKSILPLVKKKIPDCRFLIAGANPVPEVRKLENENLKVQGWLDDIREAYAESKIFIAPIFLAVGQQNKILEAMAMGLPCVTTPQVNSAIGAAPDKEVLLANDATSFAEQIVFLLKNDERREDISERGLLLVQKNFSWETAVRELRMIMEEIHPE